MSPVEEPGRGWGLRQRGAGEGSGWRREGDGVSSHSVHTLNLINHYSSGITEND